MSAKIVRLRGSGPPSDSDGEQPIGSAVVALAAQIDALGARDALILFFHEDGTPDWLQTGGVSTPEAVFLAESLKRDVMEALDDDDA